MYKEAGEDPAEVIKFISQIHQEIGNFEEKEDEESDRSVMTSQDDEQDRNVKAPELTDGGTQEPSKPHGTLLGSQQTSPAEGTVIEPATDAGGDKEGMPSMSMGDSG